ncbi:MAG: tRNA uracil 4-sulfurtransferase ThiI [Candidatus Altiarchaeota archaeon]
MDFDCILIRYGEIGLKGGNRGFFERKLQSNIVWALKREGAVYEVVKRVQGRFLVVSKDAKALEAVRNVFGIVSYSPANMVGCGVEELCEAAVKIVVASKPDSFRVTTQRLDKRMDTTSQKINEAVGAGIVARTGAKVSLKCAKLDIGLDVTGDCAYIFTETFAGLGGLPVGVSARVLCLLSGGIDSPVAAWLMMKRGCQVTLVHFMHEQGCRLPTKIECLYRSLCRFGPGLRLIVVPAAELEREIIMKAPSKDRIVILRNMFLKAAVKLLRSERAHAIVTGDNVGQVASQTIENMEAYQAGIDALVLRPLACYDKQEIIDLARRVGTFEESTSAYVDCCSFLVPKHPQTKATAEDVDSSVRSMDEGILDLILSKMIFID